MLHIYPDSKVHGANMGPTWGRQDPGVPHVGPMNIAIRVLSHWSDPCSVRETGPWCYCDATGVGSWWSFRQFEDIDR